MTNLNSHNKDELRKATDKRKAGEAKYAKQKVELKTSHAKEKELQNELLEVKEDVIDLK